MDLLKTRTFIIMVLVKLFKFEYYNTSNDKIKQYD